jgi:hypothetical protein
MAYDTATKSVVLFGGMGSPTKAFSDTWTYAGGIWTNRTATTGKSPRPSYDTSMAYSSSLGKVVLFGGENNFLAPSNLTWAWSGKGWSNLTRTAGSFPPARFSAALAGNSSSGLVLLFGGTSCRPPTSSCALGDTWEFANGQWVLPPTAFVNPPSRSGAMMTYDAKDGYVLLFGGAPGNGCATAPSRQCNDTWKFQAGAWTNITPFVSPPARYGGGMTYDAKDGYVVLFGGLEQSTYLSDTWKFVGGVWTNISSTASTPPLPRNDLGMTYDAKDGYIVLFGGYCPQCTGGHAGDTWKFVGGSWTQLSPSASPSARNSMSMTYDAKDGYVVLFGGDGCSQPTCGAETWTFSGGTWTQLSPGSAPVYRYRAAMGFDAKDGYVVLFGGNTPLTSIQHDDTWEFVGGVWTNVTATAGAMPGQSYTTMTYDPAAKAIVMLGNVYYPFTWEFSKGSWMLL